MIEGGLANCCLSCGKAFDKGDGTTPIHRIRNYVDEEGQKEQLGRRATGKQILLLLTASSAPQCLAEVEA